MATFKQYTASGGASENFSIKSFSSDEIKVRVDGVLKTAGTHYNITSYTANGGTVTWVTSPTDHTPSSGTVRIYRITDIDSARATYAAGSSVKAGDLNDNQEQVLRALREENDQLVQTWDIEDGAVTATKIAADAIDGTKIADDSINSEHYVDASIDLQHLAANSVNSSKIVDGSIVDADISGAASIAVSKLRDGGARQLLQTDTAGTGVEWTSNVDIGGTLDVTSSAAFDNNVTVSGTSTLNGNTTIDAAATVTGDTTFNGNVSHTGTGKTFQVGTTGANNKFTVASNTGNVHTVGTLGIDGDFDVATNKFTVAAATGNTVIAGNLDVTGQFDVTGTSNYTGQQTVPGGALVKNIRVGLDGSTEVSTSSGNLVLDSANGTVQVTDHLNVTGSADVDVNLNVDGTLTVDGVSTLTGNVTVGGTVDGRDLATDGTKLDGIEAGATGDQTNAEIRAAVEAASDSNVFTDADHSKLNAIEAGATADQTAAEIRTLVEAASDSNVFTDADHSKLNAIEAGATADQTAGEIKTLLASDNLTAAHLAADSVGTSEIADDAVTSAKLGPASVDGNALGNNAVNHQHIASNAIREDEISNNAVTTAKIANDAVTADKIADAAIITNSEQGSHTANDTTFYTTAASDARYYNIGSLEEIQSGETWTADDAKIATTAAIDARIVDLVDDVGGFVPIANETSFPNANPDVNNGAGTLVSIKALASNLTSNGSGVATISNGTVGNSTVTVNGLAANTTYPAGRGILVETTTTLNTYTFHRQLAEATATTTVANSISNVNTCATNISNINAVAADATDIGVVAGKETEIGRLGTADAVADMNTLGTTAIVADLETCADNNANITTVAGISSNVTAVAGNATNINAVAGNATNINAVAADAADIGAVAGKATEIGRLGTADAVADLAILGTADAVADMNTLATSDIVSDMNTLATSANVTAMDNCSDDIANINTVAGSISNVNTTAGSISNVNTVGNNIGTVNDFAARYRGPQNNAGEYTSSLDVGDLYFNTTINALKVYTGSAWVAGVTQTGDYALKTGSTYTGNSIHNDTIKSIYGTGSDLEIYHDATNNQIKSVNGKVVITTTAGNSDIEITPHGSGVVKLDGLSWPTADGSPSQYLKTNGSGVLSWGTVATDVVADTTPQLGGNLDVNGKNIQFGDSTGTMGSSPVNYLSFGADNDLYVSHSGNHPLIQNDTGILQVASDWIQLFRKNGNAYYQKMTAGGSVEIYYDGSKKFETTSSGAAVTGTLTAGNIDSTGSITVDDGEKFIAGNSSDLQLYHDGTNSNLINTAGDLYIQTGASKGIYIRPNNGENGIVVNPDSTVDLYHNNARKLRTRTDGISIIGANDGIAATYYFADDGDDDTDVWATYAGTDGTFYLTNQTDISSNSWETSIKANSNGGVELYFNASKKLQTYSNGTEIIGNLWLQSGGSFHNDNVNINIGNSNDLKLYHNASNSVIKHDGTGDFYVMTEGSNEDIYVRATGDVRLQTAGSENAVVCTANGSVELYHNAVKKFETLSNGVSVTGQVDVNGGGISLEDSRQLLLGTDDDAYIMHNGSHQYNRCSTGYYHIQASEIRFNEAAGNETLLKAIHNGAVELYYDNTKKLETTSYGGHLTGEWRIAGGDLFLDADDYKLKIGDHSDLTMYHNSGNNYLDGVNGNLYIRNRSAGGGSVRNAIVLNASAGTELYYDNTKRFETTTGGAKITGNGMVTGDFLVDSDSGKLKCGLGEDLQIFHDGSNSKIVHNGDGNLHIEATGSGEDLYLSAADIVYIRTNSSETAIRCVANGAVELYHDNVKKFSTDSAGCDFFDSTFMPDGHYAHFGDGNDMYIGHNGSHSYIQNGGTGSLYIRSNNTIALMDDSGDEMLGKFIDNGAVELYYDNSKKFETTSYGVKMSGHLYGDDGNQIRLGNSQDLELYHDGSHSYLKNATGSLHIAGDTVGFTNAAANAWTIRGVGGGGAELYHNGSWRFGSSSDGAILGGSSSVATLKFNTANGANQRAKIQATNGNEVIFYNAADERIWDYDNNGEFAAYYDNSKKLKTTSGGIDVTGAITVNGAALPSGTCLGFAYTSDATHRTYSGSWGDSGLSINYVCQNSSSKIVIQAAHNMFASPVQSTGSTTWGKGKVRINVDGTMVGEEMQYVVGLGHSGYYSHYAAWKSWQFLFTGVYSNGSTGNKNFKTQLYEDSGVLEMNKEAGTSWLTVTEYDA